MRRPFLTARWSNVCLLTYEVPDAWLGPHLPPGCELDRRGGMALASLVAFDFLDTRVWGAAWPGYRCFAEMNLRFYVRRDGRRGVVFIREIVPGRLVAWLARLIYNEPYVRAPLTSATDESADRIRVTHSLDWRGRRFRVGVEACKPSYTPEPDSFEHFLKEHQWGFGRARDGRAVRYEVTHPVWDAYSVEAHDLDFDWEAVYGRPWGELSAQEPCSVILAAGSEVAVYPREIP